MFTYNFNFSYFLAFNGGGDFIALGLFKDYILFTYNLGSGMIIIIYSIYVALVRPILVIAYVFINPSSISELPPVVLEV